MPRHMTAIIGEGWQIAPRADGYWLQSRQSDGTWRDEHGPYKRRSSAVSRYRRLEYARLFGPRRTTRGGRA